MHTHTVNVVHNVKCSFILKALMYFFLWALNDIINFNDVGLVVVFWQNVFSSFSYKKWADKTRKLNMMTKCFVRSACLTGDLIYFIVFYVKNIMQKIKGAN